MKLFYARGVLCGLGLMCWTAVAEAQHPYGAPSLLPLPVVQQHYQATYPVTAPANHQATPNPWQAGPGTYTALNQPAPEPPAEIAPLPPAPAPSPRMQPHPPSGQSYRISPARDYDPHVQAGLPAGYDTCGPMGGCDPCLAGACGPWFGSASALIMTRDRGNDVWLSFDSANSTSRMLSLNDADMDWAGGVDLRFGRYFQCGDYALEGVYWGLYPENEESNVLWGQVSGSLNSALSFNSLEYAGTAVSDVFDDSERHRIRRSYQFHNVEANFVKGLNCQTGCDPCYQTKPLCLTWLAGARYIRFDEGFDFEADCFDTVFTGDPINEMRYLVDVENHLIGAQIGTRADYHCSERLYLHGMAKLGLFGNHITQQQYIGGTGGTAFINDPSTPTNGRLYDIDSTKDDFAMLGELELGIGYKFNPCWSATLGYRALALTGVALSGEQIPTYFDDLDGVANIDSNGSLILHGVYTGVEFNF